MLARVSLLYRGEHGFLEHGEGLSQGWVALGGARGRLEHVPHAAVGTGAVRVVAGLVRRHLLAGAGVPGRGNA